MKKAVLTIAILAVLLIAYFAVSSYGAVTALKIPRVPLEQLPESVSYEDVVFSSRIDQVTLKGWYISGGTFIIIVVTGGHQNRVNPVEGTLELAKDLVDAGYSIFLFDLRGRGESEGKGLMLVHTERDIGGAVDYIKTRGHSDIAILGFSTGAASALTFVSQEGITAVVADSSFAYVTPLFIKKVVEEKNLPKLVAKFLTPGTFLMASIIYGYEKVDPVDIVADIKCPILFIHGEADNLIPESDSYQLYEASDNPLDQVWIVPAATHCQAYNTDPIGYIARVKTFLGE